MDRCGQTTHIGLWELALSIKLDHLSPSRKVRVPSLFWRVREGLVSSPDLIQRVYHFQYPAHDTESGTETREGLAW